MRDSLFTIAAVERDVGLSKDVLRVWERRYGFPTPERSSNGERLYPTEQVERLRVIKRLMDQGHRPGRLLGVSAQELGALAARRPEPDRPSPNGEGLDRLIGLVKRHAADAYVQALQQQLGREGLARFVQDTVSPLAVAVGLAWEQGRLQVFEEHLFTELTERVLRQAITAIPGGQEPRVLLTSVPNEQHAMGLLMAEAAFALEGALCIPLGTGTPLPDIVRAAAAHRADIVALSFSTAFARRRVAGVLHELRSALPQATELWAGGGGVRRLAAPQGVSIMATLQQVAAGLARWRAARPSTSAATGFAPHADMPGPGA